MGARQFLRRVGITLDRDSAGKYMSDFERTMAASGEQGARKMQKALHETLSVAIAKLHKDLADGVIDEKTFHKLKIEAERGFVQALSKGMDKLRAAGKLTDAEMVKLGKDLERVGRSANSSTSELRKMEAGGAGLKKLFTQAATWFAGFFALSKLKDWTVQLFGLGVAAGETQSKFTTTFGSSSRVVQEFLDKNAALMGLNNTLAQEYASTMGAVVQGMGATQAQSAEFSKQIVTLAGDLQSFHNVPIEETFAALRSGLTGEMDAMKRYGIVIHDADVQARALRDTHKKNKDSLTELEKAQARYNLMVERAGPAMGDLARTGASVANRMRALKAEWDNLLVAMGNAITTSPKITAFMDSIFTGATSAKGGINDLNDSVGALLDTILSLGRVWDRSQVLHTSFSSPIGAFNAVRALKDQFGAVREENRLQRVALRQILDSPNMTALEAREQAILQARLEVLRDAALAGNERAAQLADLEAQLAAAAARRESLQHPRTTPRPTPPTTPTSKGKGPDEQFLDAMKAIIQVRNLNMRELARLLALEAQYDQQVQHQTGTINQQREAAERLKLIREDLLPVARRADPNRLQATIPGSVDVADRDVADAKVLAMIEHEHRATVAHEEAMTRQRDATTWMADQWLESHKEMEDAVTSLAQSITDSMGEALTMIITQSGSAGDALRNMFKGMAKALAAEVGKMASLKASESIAKGFEELAAAAASFQNPPKAAKHTHAAGTAFVSAIKWAGVAALAGGAAGALGGGGSGGGGSGSGSTGGNSDKPESHGFQVPRGAGGATPDFTTRESSVVVHITTNLDPWNPNNPAHQDTWHRMGREAVSRRGPVEPT